jgi:hypothetical protein
MSKNRDMLIIMNRLKAILIVAIITVVLSAVVPHTQSAFAQKIPQGNQHPDHPTSPPQPTDNNPLGLIVPGLASQCGGSNPAMLLHIQAA